MSDKSYAEIFAERLLSAKPATGMGYYFPGGRATLEDAARELQYQQKLINELYKVIDKSLSMCETVTKSWAVEKALKHDAQLTLQWIYRNPGAHPQNIRGVVQEQLKSMGVDLATLVDPHA